MWLMTITVGLVTLILVKWLKDYVQRWRMPPGPFFWPIIGNLSLFSGKSYLTFIDLAKTYGDVFSLKMGMTDVVVLNSLDAVKEAFVKRGEDFAGRPKMLTTDISSEGGKDIAFSDYSPTWKLHRKLFHSAIRGYASGQNLQSKVHESLEDTVAVFSKMEGQAVDLEDYIYQLVYNVICSAAFGIRYNMDDEDFNTLMKISKDMTETFGQGLLADVYPLLRFLPSSSVTFYRKMTYQLMEIMQRHLEQHRESFDPNNLRDITDHMIKAQKDAEEEGIRDIDSLTDTHLRQLIGDIFFGGYQIPNGTMVMPNLWALHHDPDTWGDPDVFRPERFLDEDGKPIPKPAALMPFGVGRRACPGEALAKADTFLLLGGLVQNFRFSIPEGEGPPDLTPDEIGEGSISIPYPYNVVMTCRK